MHLKHSSEAKGTITVAAAENKKGNKELKNRNGKVSIVNADLRIGYGLCASACPADAIALNRRDESIEPPANIRELYLKMAEEKGRVEAFMGNLA